MAEFSAGPVHGDVGVLAVSGEIDIAVVDDFLVAARECLSDFSTLEIDLGEITFIDSSGLGALVRLRNEAAEQSKTIVLTDVNPTTQRLLGVTGLTDAFTLRPAAG